MEVPLYCGKGCKSSIHHLFVRQPKYEIVVGPLNSLLWGLKLILPFTQVLHVVPTFHEF